MKYDSNASLLRRALKEKYKMCVYDFIYIHCIQIHCSYDMFTQQKQKFHFIILYTQKKGLHKFISMYLHQSQNINHQLFTLHLLLNNVKIHMDTKYSSP